MTTSRVPQAGQRMRLDSIEIGNALPRVHTIVCTSSSCRRPQSRTDLSPSRRGVIAAHVQPSATFQTSPRLSISMRTK